MGAEMNERLRTSLPIRPLLSGAVLVPLAPLATYLLALAMGHSTETIAAVAMWVLPSLLLVTLTFVAARLVPLASARNDRRQLGPYELEQRIGQGGMGEVWQARHRMLARRAAIKVIRSDEDPARRRRLRARFDREAQVTAALSSPHTVDLYDFGSSERGSLYYVMELLDGTDLEQLVREHGPLPAERAVHLLRQVCHSLAEAHDHGLVHRDIKPSNIQVCTQGLEHDFVKVLDFGLVGLRPGASADAAAISGETALMGSLGYMPPEVLKGAPYDERSDVYSLGCVAYWLLTGQRVFERHDPTELALAHLRGTPSPPSAASELFVPVALDALVLACLERDPARRPANAHALLRALSACSLPGQWTSADAERWWSLHRGQKSAKGLALAA